MSHVASLPNASLSALGSSQSLNSLAELRALAGRGAQRSSHDATKQNKKRAIKLAIIIAAHVMLLYALSRETIQRNVMNVVKAQIISIDLPSVVPMAEPAKAPPPKTANAVPTKSVETPPPKMVETPRVENAVQPVTPLTPSFTETMSVAPTSARSDTQNAAEPAIAKATPAAAAPAVQTASPPAAPRIELPSSNADYLNNPPPPYPPQSKRLGEKGRVLLHVWVNELGAPEKVEIKQSSGFDRLDDIAIATVKRWKFVPGKKNGVAEAMWVNVPLVFELS